MGLQSAKDLAGLMWGAMHLKNRMKAPQKEVNRVIKTVVRTEEDEFIVTYKDGTEVRY